MRFYTKTKRNPVPVILPLIDILAILLIFFIVTTTFKKPIPQLQINLPDSTTAVEAPAPDKEPMVLRVKGEDAITLNDEPVILENLGPTLQQAIANEPDRGLALQADREAAFGVVVRVLDALKEAGVQNIPTFTQPQTESEPASP